MPDGTSVDPIYVREGGGGTPQIIGKVEDGGVTDTAGNIVFPDDFAQVLTYNGDGTVNTIAFTDGTNTWTQTFSYTTGKVTGISKWVRS